MIGDNIQVDLNSRFNAVFDVYKRAPKNMSIKCYDRLFWFPDDVIEEEISEEIIKVLYRTTGEL